jgi:Gamma interferon inducible lysosomal thiol reductase (GILT)
MQNQLKRTYPKIKDRVQINYVPFGKAYVSCQLNFLRFINYLISLFCSRASITLFYFLLQSFDNNGRTIFNCQHGQRECEGNIFQSCVLDAIGSQRQDVQTNFVICAMDFSKNPTNCAQNLGIDLNKISECTNGNKGLELQLKAEKDSSPVISRSFFVPTVSCEFL